MTNMVKSFKELTPELQIIAGGKGGMLSRMFQDGYPVPEGFVVLPTAFDGGKIKEEAWNQVQILLNAIRENNEGALFAVRLSALSEDSAASLKCPNCKNIVRINLEKKNVKKTYRAEK